MSLFYPLPSMSFLSFACPSLQINDHLSSVLGPLMPQGLCACCLLCLVRSSPESLITYALPSFWNLFQCYIIREPFPDNPVEAAFHSLSYMPRFTFLGSTDQPLTHCVFTGLTVNDPSLPGTMWAQTCVSLSLLSPSARGSSIFVESVKQRSGTFVLLGPWSASAACSQALPLEGLILHAAERSHVFKYKIWIPALQILI